MRDKKYYYPKCVMHAKNKKNILDTNDKIIRKALKHKLNVQHSGDSIYRIIEELGVNHGEARIDVAVVNGVMHGYEIKSDVDTLKRLPEQIKAYSNVFDKMTIIVGWSHVFEAIDIIPEWWGVTVARVNLNGTLRFSVIREPSQNVGLDNESLARLLWKEEALTILEAIGAADGVKTKTRAKIYKRLADSLEQELLQRKVRETLCFRPNWRSDQLLRTNGGLGQL